MRRAQAIFWPWFRRDREHRRDADMLPTEVLNEGVIDVLRAGAGYGRGYRAAFSYRPEEAVPQLTLPATICAPGGIFLAEHLERLPEVPANVRVEVLPAGRPAQLVRIRELLGEHRPEADAPRRRPRRRSRAGSRATTRGRPGAASSCGARRTPRGGRWSCCTPRPAPAPAWRA